MPEAANTLVAEEPHVLPARRLKATSSSLSVAASLAARHGLGHGMPDPRLLVGPATSCGAIKP